jgi:hypothetical protein
MMAFDTVSCLPQMEFYGTLGVRRGENKSSTIKFHYNRKWNNNNNNNNNNNIIIIIIIINLK